MENNTFVRYQNQVKLCTRKGLPVILEYNPLPHECSRYRVDYAGAGYYFMTKEDLRCFLESRNFMTPKMKKDLWGELQNKGFNEEWGKNKAEPDFITFCDEFYKSPDSLFPNFYQWYEEQQNTPSARFEDLPIDLQKQIVSFELYAIDKVCETDGITRGSLAYIAAVEYLEHFSFKLHKYRPITFESGTKSYELAEIIEEELPRSQQLLAKFMSALKGEKKKQSRSLMKTEILPKIMNLPTGVPSDFLMQALNSSNIDLFMQKKELSRDRSVYEVFKNGDKRRVIKSKGEEKITLEIDNLSTIQKGNRSTKKIYTFLMAKINEKSKNGNKLINPTISFPVFDLVDIGMYSRKENAYRGLKEAFDRLSKIRLSGNVKNKKNIVTQMQTSVLFVNLIISNGICTIDLNPRINWDFVAPYSAILPSYAFRLSNRGFDLIYTITYLARQNIPDIRKRSYFTIGFRTIQDRLQLPSELGNKDPQRTIKDEIERAITEIEELDRGENFNFLPVYDDHSKIKDFLDNGYLRIEVVGDMKNNMIEKVKRSGKNLPA